MKRNHSLHPAVKPQLQKALLLHTHTVITNTIIVKANGALLFFKYLFTTSPVLYALFTYL